MANVLLPHLSMGHCPPGAARRQLAEPGTPVATGGNSGGPYKIKMAKQGSFALASTQKRKRSDLPLAAIRIPHKAKMARQGSFALAVHVAHANATIMPCMRTDCGNQRMQPQRSMLDV